jgi:heterodisulfide reductase subunit C
MSLPLNDISIKGADNRLVDRIDMDSPIHGIRGCFSCGRCSASCPVKRANDSFNPRRTIRMAILGLEEEIVRSPFIWLCSTCYTCQERCPQGVKITEIMTTLKNLAFQDGNSPPGIALQWKILEENGRLYPIDDFDNKKRAKAGLPTLKQKIDEVGRLLKDLER